VAISSHSVSVAVNYIEGLLNENMLVIMFKVVACHRMARHCHFVSIAMKKRRCILIVKVVTVYMRFKMVLNCNTSVDYYFVTGNNVTIKGSVICPNVNVLLLNCLTACIVHTVLCH